tara:strand:- start:156 stop:461 length:306 start_codon:yes stop_codon:yes gene_type:complete
MLETKRENIKRKDLINYVSSRIGLPVSYSDLIVKDLIGIIISNLKEKSEIKIKNFGSFALKNKSKRIGRNPKNKIEYEISSRNVVIFKTSKYIKKKLNSNV